MPLLVECKYGECVNCNVCRVHTIGLFSSIYDYPFGRFMAILDEIILFACNFSLHFIDIKAVAEI
jgi:hypothetical protein